jgi:hypothetical protein
MSPAFPEDKIAGLKLEKMRDWEGLKLEFIRGHWETLVQFAIDKKIPLSTRSNQHSPRINRWYSFKMKGWVDERNAFLAEAAKRAAQEMMEQKKDEIKKVKERQAKIARRMQLKALKVLEDADMSTVNVETARKLLVNGLEQEREALGVNEKGGGPPSLTQVNVNVPKTKFDAILDATNYEGLLKLLTDVKRERARRIGAGAGKQGQAESQPGGTR